MAGRRAWRTIIVSCIGLALFFSSSLAHATVYGWKGEDDALNLSNDPEAVPKAQEATAKKFTSKLAAKGPAAAPAISPPPSPPAEPLSAYERGLERGLQTAERQIAVAGELARTVLAATPPAPPTRIVIQQPAQTIIRYVSLDSSEMPFYGFIGPYAPYYFGAPYSYAYGFGRSRLVPHSHFFPGPRGRRTGLFFPHGHFSQHGFLFGHGFVAR